MKKRIMSIIIPLMLVLVIGLGIILPTSLADNKDAGTPNSTPSISTYADDVVGAGEDTGASTASAGYKGGAIFLEENCTFNMKGGTISGHNNKYGGAIYISSGATFTMTGGTIENNSADYGGAIYVEKNGHCYIDGGTIQNNKAKTAPAIYAETGADVRVSANAVIKNNKKVLGIKVSTDTIEVGKKGAGIQLHYLYLGSYPQTYVGDELNSELEDWFNSSNPVKVQEYVSKGYETATGNDNRPFVSYKYTDGNLYARGTSYRYSRDPSYTYKDTTTVKDTGETAWFKVEPIKWIVLNYDEYKAGEPIEILAEEALTAGVKYNDTSDNNWITSWIRQWLNNDFLNSAFTDDEKDAIVETHLKNNITGGNNTNPNDEAKASYWPVDKETDDKIYLLTYYELYASGRGNVLGSSENYTFCSPTDYALSNYSEMDTPYETNNRLGTTDWWLRSADYSGGTASFVGSSGSFGGSGVRYGQTGVRPALTLAL